MTTGDYISVLSHGLLTADIPAATDVRLGVAVGSTTGTLAVPAASNVKLGVQYGAGGTEFTGSFVATGGRIIGG